MKKFSTLELTNEEKELQNYMFFGNLEKIKKLSTSLLEMKHEDVDNILKEHNWATDHISVSSENIEQVFNFLSNIK